MGVPCPVPGSALLYIGYLVSVCDPRAPDRAGEQPTAGRAYLLRPSWRIRFMLSSTPNAPASFPPGVDPGALMGEARGILRHCADPGPVVTTWLAEEQRAAAARTLLAALDVHPRVAMRILRHAQIDVTMNVYTDVSDAKTLQALKRLGRQLGS